MYHGLALLALGLASNQLSFSLKVFNRMIIIGTLSFSLSIYLLAIKDLIGINVSFLGPITPIGGSVLIIAWILLLIKIIRTNPKSAA